MSEERKFNAVLKNKSFLNRLFIWLMCLLELIVLTAISFIVHKLFNLTENEEAFELIALILLLLWFGILMAYYAWAIYFYNLNLGLTNESWARLKEKVRYNPDAEKEIPINNPNDGETLGLPKGSIRGSLALTLMMGALAMTIIAIGMDDTLNENEFLVDNFAFFKTAFLMMIAFYFGNKSLEMIGYKSQRVIGTKNTDNKSPGISENIPVPPDREGNKAKEILKSGQSSESIQPIDKTNENTDEFYVFGAKL